MISGIVFFTLNKLFSPVGLGDYDESDFYGTFTAKEAACLHVVAFDQVLEAAEPELVQEVFDKSELEKA